MFGYKQSSLTSQSQKYVLHQEGEQLRYSKFLTLLQEDEEFRSFFIDLLSDISFHAYQWETPPVTVSTAHQLFEFVIHHSPAIDLPPNPDPFREYFGPSEGKKIAVFDNLGSDARLIAPSPLPNSNYSHIGVFTDEAPMQQQQNLWQTVGRVTEELISDEPLWLNTAGGGVAWLHIRLDSRPKYYRYRPYMKV